MTQAASGQPRLRTHRLDLRPLDAGDVGVLRDFFNDADVGRYLMDGASVSQEWVEEEVRTSRLRFDEGSAGLWILQPRRRQGSDAPGRDTLLGIVGYRPFFDPPELQLLYALAPSAWGRGFATEAARAAIDYVFEVLGFDEVRAATDSPNTDSIRVLQRLGMTLWKTESGDAWDTLFYRLPSPGPGSSPGSLSGPGSSPGPRPV